MGSFPQTPRGNGGESAAEQEPGCGLFRRSLRRRPPLSQSTIKSKLKLLGFPWSAFQVIVLCSGFSMGFPAGVEPGSLLLDPSGSRCPVFLLLFSSSRRSLQCLLAGGMWSQWFLCRPGRGGMQKTPFPGDVVIVPPQADFSFCH